MQHFDEGRLFMQPLDTFISLTTTTSTREQALHLAKLLVEEGLAACVQVSGPVTSTYRWQGVVEVEEEWSCTAKTRAKWFLKVKDFIAANHSYDVPEIVGVKLHGISAEYARWLDEQLPQGG